MNTCWATNSWATGSWLLSAWAAVDADVLEFVSDLTTAMSLWIRTRLYPSYTTAINVRLAAKYGYTPPVDSTTLLSRFLRERA